MSRLGWIFRRATVWGTRLVFLVVVLTVVQVAALRWINPPVTCTMLSVAWESGRPPTKTWKDLGSLGRQVPRAAVASEDGWFWHHRGFDLGAIEQALEHNATSKRKKGASTISQQVARNVFLWQGRTWLRKGLEVWYTVLLEALVPKQRILEVYLNVAETGPNTFGMEAGARRWFGTSAASLNADQAARLVAILPLPAKWTPTGSVATKQSPIIQAHRVPFPGEPGFAEMAAKAPESVGWRAWLD